MIQKTRIAGRRGMTLIEVAVTGVLLSALLTVSLQLLGATTARRRAVEDHQAALIAAGNAMERVCARPWERIAPGAVADITLSPEALRSLRGGRIEVNVEAEPGEWPSRRITVAVHWQDRSGKPQRPVRLVAWRYGEGTP